MRVLSTTLETALATETRRPAYKLVAFDPTVDSISAVVCVEATQTPFDLTEFCTDISWTPAKLSFILADPTGRFHPDTGADRQYLQDGAIIRLIEGDVRVAESDWIVSFTGQIRGQVGWQSVRASQTLQSKVTVFSRDNNQAFKRRSVTSSAYTVGTEIGAALWDFCSKYLGLTLPEYNIPSVLGLQFKHKVNQLVQVAPWDGILTMLEAVGRVPFFDGDGRLSSYQKSLNRSPDLTLPDWVRIHSYEVPEFNSDCYNKIRVVFLGAELEQVDSAAQKLGDAQVTTGFFSRGETLECWWSDDHKQRAHSTYMKTIKSVNSGLLPVGTEEYTAVDVFHGEITVEISVWTELLAGALLLEYLAASLIPDGVATGGIIFEAGETIPYGRYIEAQAMVGIMLIMMSLGSAQYEIWGTPYDLAYVQKTAIAMEDDLDYWDEVELKIQNDFLGSSDQATAIAIATLVWEKSASKPRKLVIDDNLALELGDIVLLPDERKFLITGMSKTIKRGEIPKLSLDGFKVMRV